MRGMENFSPQADWASDADFEGFCSDMMLHGRAYKRIGLDGLARWVPLPGTRPDTTPAASSGEKETT